MISPVHSRPWALLGAVWVLLGCYLTAARMLLGRGLVIDAEKRVRSKTWFGVTTRGQEEPAILTAILGRLGGHSLLIVVRSSVDFRRRARAKRG